MEVESTTAVETPGEVLPPLERPEKDLPAADPAETVAPSVQEPEASTEEAEEVDFEGDAPQAVPSTPVSAGKSSEKREAPPRLDPETAKRRKLREQLRRNAELLRELDGRCEFLCIVLSCAAELLLSRNAQPSLRTASMLLFHCYSPAKDVCQARADRSRAQAGIQAPGWPNHSSDLLQAQGEPIGCPMYGHQGMKLTPQRQCQLSTKAVPMLCCG
jgi:hypothetical protein